MNVLRDSADICRHLLLIRYQSEMKGMLGHEGDAVGGQIFGANRRFCLNSMGMLESMRLQGQMAFDARCGGVSAIIGPRQRDFHLLPERTLVRFD